MKDYSVVIKDMEEPVTLSLEGLKWHYKGEGNSNLVISLSDLKMIARLYKTEDGCCKKKIDFGKARREVLFWRKILIPHLGDYFRSPVLAYLCESDAAEINRVLHVHRPKHRLNKSVRSGLVTIYPDYTFLSSNSIFSHGRSDSENPSVPIFPNKIGSTFCVEIKPKQGWTYHRDRQRKCTFCLNQFLKLENGRISRISGYCPLDLFSGNRVRMKESLRNLLVNPQNNLKIFQDGHIIYSDNSNCDYQDVLRRWFECDKVENTERLIEKWTDLVYDALTKDIPSENDVELFQDVHISYYDGVDCNPSPSIFSTLSPCDWTSEQLPKNCILNRILLLQKLQDTDFKSIYRYYKQLEHNSDDYQYVNTLLESEKLQIGALDRYLLAATAKDCSISIAFFRTSQLDPYDTNSFICEADGITYETSIGVLDLDPKPLACVAKHYNRDLNVHSAYLKFISKNEPLKNIINKIQL